MKIVKCSPFLIKLNFHYTGEKKIIYVYAFRIEGLHIEYLDKTPGEIWPLGWKPYAQGGKYPESLLNGCYNRILCRDASVGFNLIQIARAHTFTSNRTNWRVFGLRQWVRPIKRLVEGGNGWWWSRSASAVHCRVIEWQWQVAWPLGAIKHTTMHQLAHNCDIPLRCPSTPFMKSSLLTTNFHYIPLLQQESSKCSYYCT